MVKKRKGAALLSSLAVAALLSMVALCMVAALTLNMNSVQRFSNTELAQNEAEAALSELVVQVGENPNFGTNNEVIFLQPNSAQFRYLSFVDNPSGMPFAAQGLPRSTSAVNANPSGGDLSGSLGRSVPVGKLHAVATGYCRGQYVTIEAVLDVPPFPYGVATSGPLVSPSAMQVEGVSSNAVARSNSPSDRPGHVASNSTQDVSISLGTGPNGNTTHITGLVRGASKVVVAPDAEVGGLRPFASAVDLPDINLESFRNVGGTGVATMNVPPSQSLGNQVLDIAYYLPNDITYNGDVDMHNAFLFSEGNVTINGCLKGKGAIVAMGNVSIGAGAELQGDNQVAVLAGGDINVQGDGAYFSGILYARGKVTAQNLTVLGSVIANNPADPESSSATLDQVTIKGSPEMSHISFTVQSRGDVGSIEQTSMGRVPFEIGGGGGFPNSGTGGGVSLELEQQMGTDQTTIGMQVGGQLGSLIGGTDGRAFNGNVQVAPGGQPVLDKFHTAFDLATQVDSLQSQLDAAEAELASIPPPPPPDPDDEDGGGGDPYSSQRAAAEAKVAELSQKVAEATAAFNLAAKAAADAYAAYVVSHTTSNGSYSGSPGQMNVPIPIDIDLNSFMPQSARVRVGYWQLYQRRF